MWAFYSSSQCLPPECGDPFYPQLFISGFSTGIYRYESLSVQREAERPCISPSQVSQDFLPDAFLGSPCRCPSCPFAFPRASAYFTAAQTADHLDKLPVQVPTNPACAPGCNSSRQSALPKTHTHTHTPPLLPPSTRGGPIPTLLAPYQIKRPSDTRSVPSLRCLFQLRLPTPDRASSSPLCGPFPSSPEASSRGHPLYATPRYTSP